MTASSRMDTVTASQNVTVDRRANESVMRAVVADAARFHTRTMAAMTSTVTRTARARPDTRLMQNRPKTIAATSASTPHPTTNDAITPAARTTTGTTTFRSTHDVACAYVMIAALAEVLLEVGR